MSMGASSRSSISLVNWDSETSGIATAHVPVITMLSAMMPGSSSDLYCGDMRPLVVMTRPKTKTNIIGCSSVWNASVTALRRATCASRASIARNVVKFILLSLAGPNISWQRRGPTLAAVARRGRGSQRLMAARSQTPSRRCAPAYPEQSGTEPAAVATHPDYGLYDAGTDSPGSVRKYGD